MTTNPTDQAAPAGQLAQHLPLIISSPFQGDVYLRTKKGGYTLGRVDETCGEEIKDILNTYADSQRKLGELRAFLQKLEGDWPVWMGTPGSKALLSDIHALLKSTE